MIRFTDIDRVTETSVVDATIDSEFRETANARNGDVLH